MDLQKFFAELTGTQWATGGGIVALAISMLFGDKLYPWLGEKLKGMLPFGKAAAGPENVDARDKFEGQLYEVEKFAREVMKSPNAVKHALAIREEFMSVPAPVVPAPANGG